MSATIGIANINIKDIGVITSVPNNDLAKLMYYLACVFSVVQYDESNKLADYENYNQLSEEEKKLVYTLSILFDPKIFINTGAFLIKPELLLSSQENNFFKITDERIGVHVDNEIMIGGRVLKVLNIMVCEMNWLNKYYYSPLNNIIPKQKNKEVKINQTQENKEVKINQTQENKEIKINQTKENAITSSDFFSDIGTSNIKTFYRKTSCDCCYNPCCREFGNCLLCCCYRNCNIGYIIAWSFFIGLCLVLFIYYICLANA